jgi:hypothetical protein
MSIVRASRKIKVRPALYPLLLYRQSVSPLFVSIADTPYGPFETVSPSFKRVNWPPVLTNSVDADSTPSRRNFQHRPLSNRLRPFAIYSLYMRPRLKQRRACIVKNRISVGQSRPSSLILNFSRSFSLPVRAS